MAQCSRYFPPRTLKLPFGPASQRFCCLTSPMGTPGPALPFSLGWAGALTSSAVAPFCVSVSPSCSSGGFHQPLFHGLETRFKEPRRPLQQKKMSYSYYSICFDEMPHFLSRNSLSGWRWFGARIQRSHTIVAPASPTCRQLAPDRLHNGCKRLASANLCKL